MWWPTILTPLKKNITRLQMAAFDTSHRLSRCQVVIYKKKLLSEIVFLIRIWVFEFFSSSIWVVEFCHNLSCWILSQFQFLKFVKLWVKFCPHSSFWVLLQFKFLSFVTILVFEICINLSCWVFSSKFNFLSFVSILVSEFSHNLN